MSKLHVIAGGGSIFCPRLDESNVPVYDEQAAKYFVDIINKNPNDRFLIVVGGGALAGRNITNREKDIENFIQGSFGNLKSSTRSPRLENLTRNYLKDIEGIYATLENAREVSNMFSNLGLKDICPEILEEPFKKLPDNYQVLFAGGHEPDASTDFQLMKYADSKEADVAHKISNFEVMYKVSPKDFRKEDIPNYLELQDGTFSDAIKYVGSPEEWEPRMNTPLDPSAADRGLKICKKKGRENFTLNIGRLDQLENMIAGERFVGTRLKGV